MKYFHENKTVIIRLLPGDIHEDELKDNNDINNN